MKIGDLPRQARDKRRACLKSDTKMLVVAVSHSARTFIIWFTEDLTFVAAILLVYLLREIYKHMILVSVIRIFKLYWDLFLTDLNARSDAGTGSPVTWTS